MEEEGFKIVHRKRHSRAVIKKPNALNRLSIVEDNISVSGNDLLSLQTPINIIRNFGLVQNITLVIVIIIIILTYIFFQV